MPTKRIFFTVADVSGDHHAAAMIRALRELDPSVACEGLGGDAMRAAGATLHTETVRRAGMLWSGVARAAEVRRWLKETRERYKADPPALHVCVDSSGMNLYFAKVARECGVPVLYYIAPQLWASREGRIVKVRRFVNRVACILPFEEDYYRRHGVAATFVGHPLFDGLPENRRLSPEPRDVGDAPQIGVMPGSRRSEVRANLPHLLEVMTRIRQAFPRARFDIPTTPGTDALVREIIGEIGGSRDDVRIDLNAIDAMAPTWDFCLAKSGTTTLHVAAYGVPMIVVYRLGWFTWNLIGRWVIKTPSIALVNILAERSAEGSGVPRHRIVPEIIPWMGSNEPVADLAIDLLRSVDKRQLQRRDLMSLVATLDRRGASANAAKIALEMIA